MTDDINKLISELEDSTQITPLRLLAIEKIAEHENKTLATSSLVKALQDNDQDIRSYAAETLGKLKNKQALFPLIDSLS